MPTKSLNKAPLIVILTPVYPSSYDPSRGVFTQVLGRNFVRLGTDTTVIKPTKFWKQDSGICSEQVCDANVVEPSVFRPYYIPFSNKRLPLLGSTFRWTVRSFERAVRKSLSSLERSPTHFYGQFLFPAGYVASRLSKETGASSIVDLGESYFSLYEEHLGLLNIKQTMNNLDRIVTVADHLREKCVESYGVPEGKIATFRNAAFSETGPIDRVQARAELGLPQNGKIVGFVGAFDANKRPRYVLEAIAERPDISAFFLGRPGPEKPVGDQVLFAGTVAHEAVFKWLSAADVFVHASLTEMASNAVAEAKACGLPVIASDIPGNKELLEPEYSILVEPLNQGMLSRAIFQLMDTPEARARMSKAAISAAQGYTSLDRARDILEWST